MSRFFLILILLNYWLCSFSMEYLSKSNDFKMESGNTFKTSHNLFNRGYTGQYLPKFGLINMNGRTYDPWLGRMLQPDNYVQAAGYLQNYNRYSYAHNNPLVYIDPDGENPLIIAGVIVGALAGGYTGYRIADANGYNFNDAQTYGFIIGGAIIGGISGYIGASISTGGGLMSNTLGIMSSSHFSSTGMIALGSFDNAEIPYNLSIGAASINVSSAGVEFGFLGKKGNSILDNIGYGFGALANIQDIFAWSNGTNIDVKSRPKIAGHSQGQGKWPIGYDAKGNPIYDDILISVGPADQSIGQGNGLKWEMEYVKRTLQGNSVSGENVAYIRSSHPQIVTKLNNVNGKLLYNMTKHLNSGRNLLNTGALKYGLFNGCVNYTSRALFYSGVLNINALLPVTAPVLLNAELGLRNLGMLASPYLINH